MNDDWLPISDYPIPEFDKATWWKSAPSVLVWSMFPHIASYGYTKTGKGRWISHELGRIIAPTHWMPLPEAPAADKSSEQR